MPDAWPGFNPVHQVALTARGGSVRTVIVDGIPVYDEGQPLRTDPESIFVNAHASVKRRVDRLNIDAVPTWPVQKHSLLQR